jgi:AmmeMemoRadiSam system protein B
MTRPAAAAGRFYPANPDTLARLVDRLLDGACVDPNPPEPAAAYVVPHAGYQYSGTTASRVYARLRATSVGRVVIIGPAHFHPLEGCAVPSASTWLTPLGPVRIDVAGCAALARAGYATVDDAPHVPEHSIEVQLPFLQRAVGPSVDVLPIVVGPARAEAVAATIGAGVAYAPDGTIVLCSTDLSHYLDAGAARAKDARTVQAILDVAPERIGATDACGCYALRGLLHWARREHLTPSELHRSTSADVTLDETRVVGYSAFELVRCP